MPIFCRSPSRQYPSPLHKGRPFGPGEVLPVSESRLAWLWLSGRRNVSTYGKGWVAECRDHGPGNPSCEEGWASLSFLWQRIAGLVHHDEGEKARVPVHVVQAPAMGFIGLRIP